MLKTTLKTISITILLLFAVDHIQAAVQLMPPIQEIELSRGRRGSFYVTIINNNDEEMPSKFSAHDLDVTEEGRPFVADSGTARGFSKWIQVEPEEYTFQPHEQIVLECKVDVPRDAEGGYYAIIRGAFTDISIPLTSEKGKLKDTKIGLQSQAIVAILLTVPSSRNRAVIVPDTLFVYPKGEQGQSNVITDFGSQGGWEVVMPVRNDGNIHTKVSGAATIYSEAGSRVGSSRLEAGKGYVLPGKTREFKATGNSVLADGYYMLRIALQSSDSRSMSNSFAFAVYEGEVYPGATNDEVNELIRMSAPGFMLRQPFKEKRITPGGKTYLPIVLTSTTNDTLRLIPNKMEWSLNPSGYPVLGDDESIQKRSCTSWMEPVDSILVLEPGRSRSFKLKINCPDSVSGEYYSAVSFLEDNISKELPLEFLTPRTQLIALSNPRDVEYRIEVDSIRIKREVDPRLTLHRFRFKVRNTGNAHCYATGSMSFEREVAKGVFKPYGTAQDFGNRYGYLLPETEIGFEIDMPNMEPGYYRAMLAVSYETGGQPLVHYQNFRVR